MRSQNINTWRRLSNLTLKLPIENFNQHSYILPPPSVYEIMTNCYKTNSKQIAILAERN